MVGRLRRAGAAGVAAGTRRSGAAPKEHGDAAEHRSEDQVEDPARQDGRRDGPQDRAGHGRRGEDDAGPVVDPSEPRIADRTGQGVEGHDGKRDAGDDLWLFRRVEDEQQGDEQKAPTGTNQRADGTEDHAQQQQPEIPEHRGPNREVVWKPRPIRGTIVRYLRVYQRPLPRRLGVGGAQRQPAAIRLDSGRF
jgi:hypothetical protein